MSETWWRIILTLSHLTLLTKITKSTFLHSIQSSVESAPVVEGIPLDSVWIVGGMAMLQGIPQKLVSGTFGKFSEYVVKQLIHLTHTDYSGTVLLVGGSYHTVSIKAIERARWAASGSQLTKIYGPDEKVPNHWKQFLSCNQSKEVLIRFFIKI